MNRACRSPAFAAGCVHAHLGMPVSQHYDGDGAKSTIGTGKIRSKNNVNIHFYKALKIIKGHTKTIPLQMSFTAKKPSQNRYRHQAYYQRRHHHFFISL